MASFDHVRIVRAVTVVAEVHAAEPQTKKYTGGVYLPTLVEVHYSIGERGWNVSAVVSGPRLKKDGTAGKGVMTERFYASETLPDWLSTFVADNHPAGTP